VTATTGAQADHRELLLQAYAGYDSQDIEALVALISDDVDWPDDDIGRLHGKDEVRAHWPEQWARTRTHDGLRAPAGVKNQRRAPVRRSSEAAKRDSSASTRKRTQGLADKTESAA
jgi:hypothetical protein